MTSLELFSPVSYYWYSSKHTSQAYWIRHGYTGGFPLIKKSYYQSTNIFLIEHIVVQKNLLYNVLFCSITITKVLHGCTSQENRSRAVGRITNEWQRFRGRKRRGRKQPSETSQKKVSIRQSRWVDDTFPYTRRISPKRVTSLRRSSQRQGAKATCIDVKWW